MAEPWKAEVDEGRVFLTLGNYEFEVVIPPTLAESSPNAASLTCALLQEKMEAVTHG